MIEIENCMSHMAVNEQVNIKTIETKILNGRKISIKAVLEVSTKVYSNDNIEIVSNINNGEDIQVLNDNKMINSLVGQGNIRVYAKDTISIDSIDDLAEIMKVGIKTVNKEVKLSYNKVLAKADSEISILYLTEDNRIKNVNTKIPVMGFIDMENINDNNICDVDYKIKNLIIKPNNSDAHSIYVEIEIEITCFAYEAKNINLIEDLYSIVSDLKFTQKEITTMSEKQNMKEMCNIKEQISIPEIGSNQIYNVQTNTSITNKTIRKGKIIYEGEVNLEFLYEVNNGIDSKSAQIPINFEIASDNINEDCGIDTNIDIIRDDFIVNSGNIDTNIELEFSISISKMEKLSIIDEISVEENRENSIYSMVIYFVKPGDTLWKIAKKFKSTIGDIARVNGIEDINKIYIGQQLYIPKFVRKSIAV